MKTGLILIAVIMGVFMCLNGQTRAADENSQEGTVAVVNGTEISRTEFDREMNLAERKYAGNGVKLDEAQKKEVEKEVLEYMINSELLYQKSVKDDISIDPAAVEQEMKKMKSQFGSEEEFNNMLEQVNLTENDVEKQIKKGLSIQKLIETEVAGEIKIPEEDVKKYYEDNPETFKQQEQVKASHILVRTEPSADEAAKKEARQKLADMKTKIEEGADFAELAREHSECPSSSQGGDLGYFGRGQMVKPFEEAAFALDKGEVSDIVETDFGYHLIKVTDKKAEGKTDFAQVEGNIKEYLKNQKMQDEMMQYIAELKEDAEIKRML